MAGGPLFPYTAVPITTDRVYAHVYDGTGSAWRGEVGLGVQASVGADSIWRLGFELPPTLPSGTCKLRLRARASATTGVAKVNPKWASVAMEEDPGAATLQAEGTQTVTWGTGDTDQYKELKVTLDADTPVASEILIMDLTFETTSWTLAVQSCWQATIIWE